MSDICEKDKHTRTIDILDNFNTHLDQPQLIDPSLKISYKPFKHIHPIRPRQRMLKEFKQLFRQLMP
jgi:hypothetical protein